MSNFGEVPNTNQSESKSSEEEVLRSGTEASYLDLIPQEQGQTHPSDLQQEQRASEEEGEKRAVALLEQIQTGALDVKNSQENSSESEKLQKYLEEIEAHPGYEGTRLQFMPDSTKADRAFMLKVAESNPSAVLRHASLDLQNDKQFVIQLIQTRPRAGYRENEWRSNVLSPLVIQEITPQFYNDKEVALALINEGEYSSLPLELILENQDLYDLIKEKELERLTSAAQRVDRFPQYPSITTFKVKDDGQTRGGVQRNLLIEDQSFLNNLENSVTPYVDMTVGEDGVHWVPKREAA